MGKSILTGSRDNTAILWGTCKAIGLQSFSGHTDDPFTAVAFAPDGQNYPHRKLRIRRLSCGACKAIGYKASMDILPTFLAVAFAPDGQSDPHRKHGDKNGYTVGSARQAYTKLLWTILPPFTAVAFAPDGQIYPHRKQG